MFGVFSVALLFIQTFGPEREIITEDIHGKAEKGHHREIFLQSMEVPAEFGWTRFQILHGASGFAAGQPPLLFADSTGLCSFPISMDTGGD